MFTKAAKISPETSDPALLYPPLIGRMHATRFRDLRLRDHGARQGDFDQVWDAWWKAFRFAEILLDAERRLVRPACHSATVAAAVSAEEEAGVRLLRFGS